MTPILYRKEATSFGSQYNEGLIAWLADAISCTVEEERNGKYELEMVYPIDGKWFSDIEIGRIIAARHSDRTDVQAFRIYRISRPIDGKVTVFAHHISYDLNRIVVMPYTAGTAAEALLMLNTYAVSECPFTFWTDKTTAANFAVEVPTQIRAALGGTEGSVLDTFGGEFEWNNFTVRLYASRGTDSGVTIRYGKNLTDITHITDDTNMVNAVAPYWQDSEGNVVTLSEGAIIIPLGREVPYTDQRGIAYTNENNVEYTGIEYEEIVQPLDLSEYFQEQPTEEELRDAAETWLANNGRLEPETNITVSFVQLWQTEEFKDIAPLLRVGLCDTVSVIYEKLGVNATTKVIRTRYNVLLERYDEMELGEARATLSQTINGNLEVDVEGLKNSITSIGGKVAELPTQSIMDAAIDHATRLISGGLGGYVVINTNAAGQPNEILVMDTPDMASAMNVLRINNAGIGFSNSGYSGTYRTAWTLEDAAFVADFITAGTLTANIIKAGILADVNGRNYWNMVTGDAHFDGMVTFGDLSEDGGTVINGGNITTGRISSANEKVYFDLNGNEIRCDVMTSTDTDTQITLNIGNVRQYTYGALNFYDTRGAIIKQPDALQSVVIAPSGEWDTPDYIRAGGEGLGIAVSQYQHHTYTEGSLGDTGFAGMLVQDGRLMICGAQPGSLANAFSTDPDASGFAGRIIISSRYTKTAPSTSTNDGKIYLRGNVDSWAITATQLSVSGSKSRVVETDQYDDRLLYCYETPTPMFGDIGEGVIGDDGACYVWTDPVFAATIGKSQYQVFLQCYGAGSAYVADRSATHFVVQGTPGLPFGWEIKAKQAGYEEYRLERNVARDWAVDENPGDTAQEYLTNLRNGRIAV